MFPINGKEAAAILGGLIAFAMATEARAETLGTCTGFITTVPAVIDSQGVWCLQQGLATAVASGNAITINANNVTLDCNDMKLGALAAPLDTIAVGVYANNRVNLTVRRCNIRGFHIAVMFEGSGGGHVVEDNRIGGTTHFGIQVFGDGSVIRRNEVFDIGGSTVSADAYGIYAGHTVDVLENRISGVMGTAGGNGYAVGIYTSSNVGGRVVGNGVRNLIESGTASPLGIYNVNSVGMSIRDNDLQGSAGFGDSGVYCTDTSSSARDNTVIGFALAMDGSCSDDGGNVFHP